MIFVITIWEPYMEKTNKQLSAVKTCKDETILQPLETIPDNTNDEFGNARVS
jgi:hypothetical protein